MSSKSSDSGKDSPAPVPPAHAAGRRVLDVQELLGGQREVVLRHRSEEYRLRLTRNSKLILTK